MAIYDPKVGEGVIPILTKQSGFSLDESSFNALDSAIKNASDRMEQDFKATTDNIEKVTAVKDSVTNMRADNALQQSTIDEVKKNSGIENIFNTVSLETLKNPYGSKVIESSYNQFAADPKIAKVVMEQAYSDKFVKELNKIQSAELRKMALQDYDKYRNAEISGDQLSSDAYMDMDVFAVIGKDFKDIVPKLDAHFQTDKQTGAKYVETVKERDATAMKLVFEKRLSDPQFVNNLAAMGLYDKEGKALTEEGNKYLAAFIDQYEMHDKNMKYVKFPNQGRSSGSSGGGSGRSGGGSGGSGGSGGPLSVNNSGRVTYPLGITNTAGDREVNTTQNKMAGKFGIDVVTDGKYGGYIKSKKDDDNNEIRGDKLEKYIVRKAVKDVNQNPFLMLAAGHKKADVANALVNYDAKQGTLTKYSTKKGDTLLRDAIASLDEAEQWEFIARAKKAAQDYLDSNPKAKANTATKAANKTGSGKNVVVAEGAAINKWGQ